MNIIDKIRLWAAKRNLQKIPRIGDSKFLNLSEIKSLTLLYYLNEPLNIDAKGQYKEMFALLEDLKQRGIKCELTFFVEDSLAEAKRINMSVFTKDECSFWTFKPGERTYSNFMSFESDALINLSPVTCWPLEYLAQYSQSKFKIAVQREEQGAKYDFLFKPADDTTFPLGVYNQIISYLEVINR